MNNNKYPNNLRLYRQKAGLRQIDVGHLIGVDFMDRVSRWENGSSMPNMTNLFRLAALYKVSPQDLYQDLWQGIKKRQEERSRYVKPGTCDSAEAFPRIEMSDGGAVLRE